MAAVLDINTIRGILYNHKLRTFSVIFILLSLIFVIGAKLSGGNLSEKIYDAAYHVSAIAVVIILTEFVLADFNKFVEKHSQSELTKSIRDVENYIRDAVPSTFTENSVQIFLHTLPWIQGVQSSVNVTASMGSPRAPSYWFEALMSRMRDTIKQGRSINYNVKFLVDFSNYDKKFVDHIEERVSILAASGNETKVNLTFIDSRGMAPWDIMIVDHSQVALRFCPDIDDLTNSFSICFDGSPEIGRAFSDWYDKIPAGISVDKLRNQSRYKKYIGSV